MIAPAQRLPPSPPAETATSKPEARRDTAKRRASGEELLADVFQEMHQLAFCADSLDAASFTLALALEKLASDAGIVHLYDIDRREFVVVSAAGPGILSLCGLRTSESDPLAAEALRTRGAVLVHNAEADLRAQAPRWGAVRSALAEPLRCIACARAAQAGRFLGLLELCNGEGTGAFEAGDEHALSYLAERFTEFVAAHGVTLGKESSALGGSLSAIHGDWDHGSSLT
jgi:hypothetical protein